jgi:CheY-like chemotaxis protein/HPt (histidine-containing phosphotransfer) domain-containing protein
MPNATTPIRLLLVDDDELSRDVLALQIVSLGYHVDTADSGDAALHHLRHYQPPPTAILTDWQMPGTSGLALGRQLRHATTPTTILVAMSGSHPTEDVTSTYNAFLLKPFTMQQLAAALTPTRAAATHPASTQQNTGNILDQNIYARLAASMPAAQLQQLFTLCLADSEKRIEHMRHAAAEADDATYRREAHAIKGSCSMVGALELHRLASTAEQDGYTPANHLASLDEMLLACERLRRILVAHQNRATT